MPGRVWTPNASTCLLLKGLADVPWGPQARVLETQCSTPQLDPNHVLTVVRTLPTGRGCEDTLPLPTGAGGACRLGRNAVPVVVGYGQKPAQSRN